ncbi:MAG: PAS domain S-box protein [Desulfomonile tiedjei]|nr:PAS domain S-box protein [Desulfomonile tiedjei]
MDAPDDRRTIIARLHKQATELEEQVKRFVTAERIQYDLQARLDLQLKTQTQLLRLSERLHHCRDEAGVAALVAEGLVEHFEFEKAVVMVYSRTLAPPSAVALDGYYAEGEADRVRQAVADFLYVPGPGQADIRVERNQPPALLGMDDRVSVVCRSSTGDLLGCIVFGTSRDRGDFHRTIDDKDRPVWETVASLTSTALENARLYEELARERESLKKARDHLRELNEQLELLVRERTRALAESESRFKELYWESQRNSEMYRTLLDVSPDPIIVCDVRGWPVYLNPAFSRVFGWTFDEVKGRSIAFVPPEEQPESDEMIRKVVNGISFSNQETRRYTKDGRIIDVSISGASYFDQAGKAAGSIIHLRDITNRKKLEEELSKVGKLKAVGRLAGGIAHDFNNLFSGILMNAQLAEQVLARDPAGAVGYLSGIQQATERAAALTQQLLTFAEGGAPVRRAASIAQLIKDSVEYLSCGSGVQYAFTLPESLWPVEIDHGQMSQVISHLVINAAQAMDGAGVIQVTGQNVALREEDTGTSLPLKPGRYVKVSIEDHGRGIPAENLQRVFDPYFSTKDGGSGLGLAITFSIVSKHHGYISVDSRLNQGSTFHVYLPATETDSCAMGSGSGENRPAAGEGSILVMDDEEILRQLVTDLLTSYGYEVTTAADGEQAVKLYDQALSRGQAFDVVLMDLTVPGRMGGKDAMQRLLEIDPHVKAVVCSGYSNDPIMADYRRYGFQGVVGKPYRAERLIEELNRILHNSDSHE